MKTLLIIGIMASVAMGLVSCGKKTAKKTPSAPEATQKEQAAPKQETRPLTIKGFYIGMSEQQIREAGVKNLPGFQLARSQNPPGLYFMMKELSDSVMASGQWKMGCDWILCFSEQDKLVEFDIGNEVVNYLFSAKDLNAEEFVAKFAEAYHTPEFKHRPLPQDDSVWVWDCITPDNVLVRIQENKSIGMFKQKASNPQNGFN